MDRIEIVNKYCGGGTLPKVITEPSPDHTRKEHGDVVLGPGNITLKAGYTEIRNSTLVPLGTTLTIEN